MKPKCQCIGCVNGAACLKLASWRDAEAPMEEWEHSRVMHERRLEKMKRERERWATALS